jgi:hypothetical protein
MRPLHSLLAVLPFAAALLFTACKKEGGKIPEWQNPVTYSPKKLEAAFSSMRSTPQTFTVMAGTFATVTGAQGTRLRFYPGSFKNASGATITSGNVQIQLIEAYKAGDMIRNRSTTMQTDGSLLTSGGEVKVVATQNGQALTAGKYGIDFRQSAPSSQPMRTFSGVASEQDGAIDWVAGPTTPGNDATGTIADTASNTFYYIFDSVSNFNWINCDYFYNQQNRTAVKVVLPDTTFNSSTTAVFAIFPSMNAVARSMDYTFSTTSASLSEFSFKNNYRLPVGLSVKLVVITKKSDGSYYSYIGAPTAVTADMNVSVTPAATTEAAIIAALGAL